MDVFGADALLLRDLASADVTRGNPNEVSHF